MKTNADVISGALLFLLGAGTSIYSSMTMELGDAARMGPGAFPTVSGLILALLGITIALSGIVRNLEKPDISWFRLSCICTGMVGFAYIIPWLGLLPGIAWLTFLSIFASGELRLGRSVVLSAVLSSIAYVVFVVAFEANIPLVAWAQP